MLGLGELCFALRDDVLRVRKDAENEEGTRVVKLEQIESRGPEVAETDHRHFANIK